MKPEIRQTPKAKVRVPAYSPSSPILIQSDDDFETQGWPGEGSAENPYLIEGLNITSDEDCIIIYNTTDYFTIRGCFISSVGTKIGTGILFNETTNGLVEDCWIQNKHRAYLLSSSQKCVVRNCTASNNDGPSFTLSQSEDCLLENNTATLSPYGFYLDYSIRSTLRDNIADDHTVYGFWLIHSGESILTGNEAYLCSSGFYLYESEDCVLVDNKATGSHSASALSDGFRLDYSQRSILKNCRSFDNQRHGLFLYWSPRCAVENNSMSMNGIHGLAAWNSGRSTISDNTASENGDSGMYLWHSDGVSLIDNNVSLNLENGVHLLSSDECLLRGNDVEHNDIFGFFVESSSDTYLEQNYAEDNEDGYYVYYSNNSTLIRNTAHKNMDVGIELHYSDNCTVIGNQVSNQTHHGIWIRDSGTGCRLYYNLIMYNGVNPSYYNAIDSGTLNIWDDSVDLGNFWSDYDGTGPYTNMGVEDRYPQTAEYYITEFPPTIDHPNDVDFEVGSLEYMITWNPHDYSPDSYIIFRNEGVLDSGEWNGGPISIALDGLEFGVFNYTLHVNDTYNNTSSDTVLVTVVDTTPPILNSLPDVEYESGKTGNELVWFPVDCSPDSFQLYIDSVLNNTGTWFESNITFNIDGLDVGIYNYTLVIFDMGGNSASDSVIVTVTETTTTSITTTTTTSSTITTSSGTTETTSSTTTTSGNLDATLILLVSGGAIGVLVVVVIILKKK